MGSILNPDLIAADYSSIESVKLKEVHDGCVCQKGVCWRLSCIKKGAENDIVLFNYVYSKGLNSTCYLTIHFSNTE